MKQTTKGLGHLRDSPKESIKNTMRDKVAGLLFDTLMDKDIGAITPQSLERTLIELGVSKFIPEPRLFELIEAFADGRFGENPTISQEAMTAIFHVSPSIHL